jgi:glycosyltransferase involved in cell wall biosynthesis
MAGRSSPPARMRAPGNSLATPAPAYSALADALRPVIADPALRARLRQAAQRAAGRFTRETLGAETIALYEAAIRRFQPR